MGGVVELGGDMGTTGTVPGTTIIRERHGGIEIEIGTIITETGTTTVGEGTSTRMRDGNEKGLTFLETRIRNIRGVEGGGPHALKGNDPTAGTATLPRVTPSPRRLGTGIETAIGGMSLYR